MSADLNTSIDMRGTTEELLSMLKVLRVFETEKREQYQKNRNCGYIESVKISGASGRISSARLSDQEMIDFLAEAGTELRVQAAGPWGAFHEPGEAGLFEALAEAAPNAYFDGMISGFITGADVSHSGTLTDCKLLLSNYYVADETFPELYVEDVKKKLSYAKFCRLFKVDKEEFESDCYGDFLMDAMDEGFPSDMDYDSFMDLCDCSEIDEEQFEAAIEKTAELGIVDFETFRETFDEDAFCQTSIYDPVTKTYESSTLCDGLTFVVTGKVFTFKNREDLSKYIESQGGKVSGSVSKNTNYLINNDASSNSSKNKKAQELGVPIITEADFINMFGKK